MHGAGRSSEKTEFPAGEVVRSDAGSLERIQGSQEIRDRKSHIVTPRNYWGVNARATTGNVSEAMQPEQEGDACCRCELCMCCGPG